MAVASASGRDTGNRAEGLQQRLLHLRDLIRCRGHGRGNDDADRLQAHSVESRHRAPHRDEGANHQAGAHEQHQRERHLRDHQSVACPYALAAVAGAARAGEGPREPRGRVLERRNQPEQNAGQDRHQQREHQHPSVHRDLLQPRQPRGPEHFEDSHASVGQSGADGTSEQPEQHAFEQPITDQPPPPRAECHSHRELLLAAFRADEHEVGDVGARDQHHDADCRHEHPEDVRHAVYDAVLQRLGDAQEVPAVERTGTATLVPRRHRPRPAPQVREACEIGIGLREGHAGFQPSHHLVVEEDEDQAGAIERLWHQHLGLDGHHAEAARHDADDRQLASVAGQRPADDRGVAAEAALPVAPPQDHRAGAIQTVVGAVEGASQHRAHAQRVHHAVADADGAYLFRGLLGSDREWERRVDAEALE